MAKKIGLILLFSILFITLSIATAQRNPSVNCGMIIDGEVNEDLGFIQYYDIDLNPGDGIDLRAVPIGDTFAPEVGLSDPTETSIGFVYTRRNGTPVELSRDVSATGNYVIRVHGIDVVQAGAYTLYIGCTLRDGTVIEPSTTLVTQNSTAISEIIPNFSGFGLPSLPSVDFAEGVTLPFSLDNSNPGSISDGFVGIFDYAFAGNEGQSFTLEFARTAGNLNLGLAVISTNNDIVFQVSLINNNRLSTEFTLPATDTYTIGVYRINLNPPDIPEVTSFEITGSIN